MKINGTKIVPYKSKNKNLDKMYIANSNMINDEKISVPSSEENNNFGLSDSKFESMHQELENKILKIFIKLCDLMKKYGYERSNVKYYDDGIFLSIQPIDMYNWFHKMNIHQKKDLMSTGLGKEMLSLFSHSDELELSDFEKDVKIFNHNMDMLIFNKASLLKIDFIIKYFKLQQEIVTLEYFK